MFSCTFLCLGQLLSGVPDPKAVLLAKIGLTRTCGTNVAGSFPLLRSAAHAVVSINPGGLHDVEQGVESSQSVDWLRGLLTIRSAAASSVNSSRSCSLNWMSENFLKFTKIISNKKWKIFFPPFVALPLVHPIVLHILISSVTAIHRLVILVDTGGFLHGVVPPPHRGCLYGATCCDDNDILFRLFISEGSEQEGNVIVDKPLFLPVVETQGLQKWREILASNVHSSSVVETTILQKA